MFSKIKTWLTASAEGKRIVHYVETFGLVFASAAIATWQKLPPHSYTWAAIGAVVVAGGKAVLDLLVPLIVAKVTTDTAKT